jgi:hypothetical protein
MNSWALCFLLEDFIAVVLTFECYFNTQKVDYPELVNHSLLPAFLLRVSVLLPDNLKQLASTLPLDLSFFT